MNRAADHVNWRQTFGPFQAGQILYHNTIKADVTDPVCYFTDLTALDLLYFGLCFLIIARLGLFTYAHGRATCAHMRFVMHMFVDLAFCSTRGACDIIEDPATLRDPKGLAHFSLLTFFSKQGWSLQQAVNVPPWGN